MMQGSLARKLRILRAERGLTQERAARVIGITPETLSDLERGKRRAYGPTLSKIAKGYGVSVEELIEEPVPLAGAEALGELGRAEAEALIARIQRNLDTLRGYMEHPPDEDTWDSALDEHFHLMEGGGPLHVALQLLEQGFQDRQLLIRLVRVTEEFVLMSSQIEAFNLTQYGHRHRDAG